MQQKRLSHLQIGLLVNDTGRVNHARYDVQTRTSMPSTCKLNQTPRPASIVGGREELPLPEFSTFQVLALTANNDDLPVEQELSGLRCETQSFVS